MKLTQTTAASAIVEPVLLAEMREQLRIEHDAEDAYLLGIIGAARARAEQEIDGIIAPREFLLTLDAFADEIELPLRPVDPESIVVQYIDANNATQSVSSFNYYAINETVFITPDPGASWPTPGTGKDKVRITFTAGFTETPLDIKHAILMIGASLHDQRRDHSAQTLNRVPMSSQMLLEPYRRTVL